jgi:hypothetical protein
MSLEIWWKSQTILNFLNRNNAYPPNFVFFSENPDRVVGELFEANPPDYNSYKSNPSKYWRVIVRGAAVAWLAKIRQLDIVLYHCAEHAAGSGVGSRSTKHCGGHSKAVGKVILIS